MRCTGAGEETSSKCGGDNDGGGGSGDECGKTVKGFVMIIMMVLPVNIKQERQT